MSCPSHVMTKAHSSSLCVDKHFHHICSVVWLHAVAKSILTHKHTGPTAQSVCSVSDYFGYSSPCGVRDISGNYPGSRFYVSNKALKPQAPKAYTTWSSYSSCPRGNGGKKSGCSCPLYLGMYASSSFFWSWLGAWKWSVIAVISLIHKDTSHR